MPQDHHGRKHYWLRGAIAATVMEMCLIVLVYLVRFHSGVPVPCYKSGSVSICGWTFPGLGAFVWVFQNPFENILGLRYGAGMTDWQWFAVHGLRDLNYLVASFAIGAAAGWFYGRVVTGRRGEQKTDGPASFENRTRR